MWVLLMLMLKECAGCGFDLHEVLNDKMAFKYYSKNNKMGIGSVCD